MVTLAQILQSQSSILEGKRVKLVRHKDSRAEYRDAIKDRSKLLSYQQKQGRDAFGDCEYIVSFMGLERSRSLFFGVFKVLGSQFVDGHYLYNLQQVEAFDGLVDRLVIDWGASARAWLQWYDRQEKAVIEILPSGYIGSFPGLQDFVLEFDELKTLIDNPEANHDWNHHLSAVNGVYLIKRMVKEAEESAGEDKKRKESVEIKNRAEALVHTTEKTLKELGDKVLPADRSAVETAISDLKSIMSGEDISAIRKNTETLRETSIKLGEGLYREGQEDSQGSDGSRADSSQDSKTSPNVEEPPVVDAEFTEVDGHDNKNKSA